MNIRREQLKNAAVVSLICYSIQVILWIGPAKVAAQTSAPESHGAIATQDCAACHSCAAPTKSDSCLKPCPRNGAESIAKAFEQMKAPQGVILLNMLTEAYRGRDSFGPVAFDHSGHAAMAELTGGCAACHHFTPEGAKHPACRTCHELTQSRNNIRQPSLKGAYHRQCMGCHREWAHETACRMCHLPKVGQDQLEMAAGRTYMAQKHPPIPEPEIETYEIDSSSDVGSEVIFRHREHTRTYGFKCVECHAGDSCMRCHEEGKKHQQHVRTLEEHHQPCSACHEADMQDAQRCQRCHHQEGQPAPKPFTHDQTGWPLSSYHESLVCRDCHKQKAFYKLDRECNSCHADWSPETFDHRVTGQGLNTFHADVDCEDCHEDRRFDQPPVCWECHDEDSGIAFPGKRPGPFVKPPEENLRPPMEGN